MKKRFAEITTAAFAFWIPFTVVSLIVEVAVLLPWVFDVWTWQNGVNFSLVLGMFSSPLAMVLCVMNPTFKPAALVDTSQHLATVERATQTWASMWRSFASYLCRMFIAFEEKTYTIKCKILQTYNQSYTYPVRAVYMLTNFIMWMICQKQLGYVYEDAAANVIAATSLIAYVVLVVFFALGQFANKPPVTH